MLKKILFCSLIINITSFTFSFNIISDIFNYRGVVYNPYRVFGLPPWTSMKKIKKKYKELVKKYHPDKSHTRKEFETCLSLMEAKKIDVTKFVSDVVGLDDVQTSYERLTSGTDDAVKILVDPNK